MPSTIRISQFFLNVVSPTLLVYSEISQLLHSQHGSNAINEAQDKQRKFSAASRRVPRLTPSPFNLSSLAESAKRGTCFFFRGRVQGFLALWFFFPVPHTPSSRVGLGFAVGAVPSGRHLGVRLTPKRVIPLAPSFKENEVRKMRNSALSHGFCAINPS
jgi:hypothetical protein